MRLTKVVVMSDRGQLRVHHQLPDDVMIDVTVDELSLSGRTEDLNLAGLPVIGQVWAMRLVTWPIRPPSTSMPSTVVDLLWRFTGP